MSQEQFDTEVMQELYHQEKKMKVYEAISKVAATLAAEGISKNRKNQQQNYSFRGIDDVYNALASVLANNGLVILPRVLNREVTERTTVKGGVLFYVVVEVEFDFVCAEDGSAHTVKTFGEAMDSADKATNKAMSAAYKYACMQAFCIPTEGDNDADAISHEVVPVKKPAQPLDIDRALKAIRGATNLVDLNKYYQAAMQRAADDQEGTLTVAFEVAREILSEGAK